MFQQKKEFNLLTLSQENEARYFVAYLSNENFSNISIMRKISALRTFYNFLIERYNLKHNIFKLIKLKKNPRKLPLILSESFIKKLFDSIDTTELLGYRNYIILDLLYSCGLRISELVNLKIKNIYLNNAQILIYGKGKKERFLPLHKNLVQMIKYYLSNVRNKFLDEKNKSNPQKMIFY